MRLLLLSFKIHQSDLFAAKISASWQQQNHTERKTPLSILFVRRLKVKHTSLSHKKNCETFVSLLLFLWRSLASLYTA